MYFNIFWSIPVYFTIFQSLTNGSGFYEVTSKEMWSEGRKLVIRNKETGDYTDDFSGVSKGEYGNLAGCLKVSTGT